jgi:NAD-dependent deacetylase
LAAHPNSAHRSLSEASIRVITQNIDGLHQKAGSKEVIELHGTLHRIRCISCCNMMPVFKMSRVISECEICGGLLWPDIVLEGENVRSLAMAINWISTTELLLIIGTKLEMAPINQLPLIAKRRGIPVLVINRDAESIIPLLVDKTTTETQDPM